MITHRPSCQAASKQLGRQVSGIEIEILKHLAAYSQVRDRFYQIIES